jgi:hypothetical protein
MSTDGEASRVHNLGWALDVVRTPLLHRGAIYVLALVLRRPRSAIAVDWGHERQVRTSKAIQLMGSSSGMSVFLTNSSLSVSVSKATVMMTPGGVHVPIMRWCLTIVLLCVLSTCRKWREA